MRGIHEFKTTLMRMAPTEGIFDTSMPGVSVLRLNRPTVPELVVYEPTLCFIANGIKETRIDTLHYRYGAGEYLLGSVRLPVTGAIVDATADNPYLCLRMDLDARQLLPILETAPPSTPDTKTPRQGLCQHSVDAPLCDAVVRAAEIASDPEQARNLGSLITQEILWRIQKTPGVRDALTYLLPRGKHRGLIKTIEWLEAHYASPVAIEDLAQMANMSGSAFHAQFKQLTGTTPLRFRMRLRLIEARRLMLGEGMEAAKAGFAVGYAEPAQFSREYTRLFGMPPRRDIERLKGSRLEAFVL